MVPISLRERYHLQIDPLYWRARDLLGELTVQSPKYDGNFELSPCSTKTLVISPKYARVVPLSTVGYSGFSPKHSGTGRPARDPSFSRPYALAISVFLQPSHNAPKLYASSQEIHMEEINSMLYDMHGTVHVILIAALFVILLIVR